MTAKSSGSAPQPKRTRTATVSYPYHHLEMVLSIVEAVKQVGNGRQAVSKSLLASHLQIDEHAGEFAQKLASAKTFGLLDGRSDLILTELSRSYFYPTSAADTKKPTLLKALINPGAFKALVDRYDGTKPLGVEIIGNVLTSEYGIPESWKIRVATHFLKSAAFAGAIGPDGFLRYKANLQGAGLPSGQSTPLRESQGGGSGGGEAPEDRDREPEGEGVIIWKYPFQGKMLRLETPENLTPEIWEKLNRYIQVLKP